MGLQVLIHEALYSCATKQRMRYVPDLARLLQLPLAALTPELRLGVRPRAPMKLRRRPGPPVAEGRDGEGATAPILVSTGPSTLLLSMLRIQP